MKKFFENLQSIENLGLKLGSLLEKGDVICLNGNLGAGKTTLTKSIAKGMGIYDYITSPTFTIINEYYGNLNLYHFDTYRLDNLDEASYLYFDEYFYGNGVCVIEWADKIKELLPEDYLELNITGSGNIRKIEFNSIGKRSESLLKDLEKELL